jgi:hypothetical protein
MILFFVLRNLQIERTKNNDSDIVKDNFIFEFIILISIIPIITITDSEHFLLSIPLIMYILFNFSLLYPYGKKFYIGLLIVVFLLYGGNWHDLIGHNMSSLIDNYGVLGYANILLIVIALMIKIKKEKSYLLIN